MEYNIDRLKYHTPTAATNLKYALVNAAFQQLASVLVEVLPDSADSTVAMRQVELARMLVNSAIANN